MPIYGAFTLQVVTRNTRSIPYTLAGKYCLVKPLLKYTIFWR